jgi:epoxyqueuosine reductase
MAPDREAVRARLRALGFDEVRFARVAGTDAGAAALRAWLDAGRQADMAWMERTAEKRADPGRVLPGARTVIMLGVNYWDGQRGRESGARSQEPETGDLQAKPEAMGQYQKIQIPLWARYALHADYHDTLKPALVAAGRVLEDTAGAGPADYRYYADTGPVLERGWAERAGLGFIGKNAMLISPRHGNWLLLSAIVTVLDFEPDGPLRKESRNRSPEKEAVGLLCGKCTRCLDACPTRAFAAPGVVDARRCISYQTIENRGIIPRELRAGIGDHIYGCDVCLEVCPWNRFAQAGRRVLLQVRGGIAALTLCEILELTPGRFAEVFRGTSIKRLKLAGLLRNACVVAGNQVSAGGRMAGAGSRTTADRRIARAAAETDAASAPRGAGACGVGGVSFGCRRPARRGPRGRDRSGGAGGICGRVTAAPPRGVPWSSGEQLRHLSREICRRAGGAALPVNEGMHRVAGRQQFGGPEHLVFQPDAGHGPLAQGGDNLQFVVVTGRTQVARRNFEHGQEIAGGLQLAVGQAVRLKQRGAPELKPRQVAAVIGDAHHVGLGVADVEPGAG